MKNLENGNDHIENLIHEYLSGTILQKDKDDLFCWLAKDSENVKYFNQISDIWLSSSVFQDTQNFDTEKALFRIRAKINYANNKAVVPKTKGIRLTWLNVAAILIPIIFISGLSGKLIFTNKKEYSQTPFIFEVPYGSKATVSLPDSSRVVLNAGSKLTFKEGFGETHRILNLTGEGYFNVAKNKALPFIVCAGDLEVKALGTEFNVKAYPEDDKVSTILIHGSIQVKKNKLKRKKTDNPFVLQPKQSLVYDKNTDSIQINVPVQKDNYQTKKQPIINKPNVIVSKTNIDQAIYTTWKEESWTIYRLSLLELAIELERKYDVKIHFKSEKLKQIKFSGTLPDISIEQVLSAIRLTSPIKFKIKGKEVELVEEKSMMPEFMKYYHNAE